MKDAKVQKDWVQGRNKSISNRANEIRRDQDLQNNLSIDLLDIDSAVMEYIQKVIQPSVTENNELVNVPVLYGSPERWKSVQEDGYFKDQNGTIIIPLIMFARTGITKNNQLAVDKLNGNVFYSFKETWNPRNRYDNFSIQTGIQPSKKMTQILAPDYVNVTYACKIWTEYVQQMNHLIELFIHAEGSYWGDPNKFKFHVSYDSLNTSAELSSEEDRKISTDFNIELKGYLIKDAYNNAVSDSAIGFDTTQKRMKIIEYVVSDISQL